MKNECYNNYSENELCDKCYSFISELRQYTNERGLIIGDKLSTFKLLKLLKNEKYLIHNNI